MTLDHQIKNEFQLPATHKAMRGFSIRTMKDGMMESVYVPEETELIYLGQGKAEVNGEMKTVNKYQTKNMEGGRNFVIQTVPGSATDSCIV